MNKKWLKGALGAIFTVAACWGFTEYNISHPTPRTYAGETMPPAMQNYGIATQYWMGVWQTVEQRSAAMLQQPPQAKAFNDFLGPLEYLRDRPVAEKAEKVNAYVNKAITYCSDTDQYHALDYWATPSETLASRKGDCEDYAILKYHCLRALGVPSDSMCVSYGDSGHKTTDHAILVVDTAGAFTPQREMADGVLALSNGKGATRLSHAGFRSYCLMGEKNFWVCENAAWQKYKGEGAKPVPAVQQPAIILRIIIRQS